MNEQFEGKILLNEKNFNFVYQNKILTVFPNDIENNWKEHNGLFYISNKGDIDKKILNGTKRDGRSISFIDVTLKQYGRGILKGYVPAYIVSKPNNYIEMPPASDFNKIVFKGGIINKLYSPYNFISKSNYDFEEKKPCIEFKSMDTVNKKIRLNDDMLSLAIGFSTKDSEHIYPIKLNSQLEIDFSTLKNVFEIKDYFLNIYKSMCFLFNRRVIKFDEVILCRKIKVSNHEIKDGELKQSIKEETILYNLIINDEQNQDNINELNINLDVFLENFESLYNIISDKMFPINYYPKNNYDDTHFDCYQFIKVACAFEGQFDACFPDYKSTHKLKFKEAKDATIEILKEISKNEKRKKKKYYEDFKEIIESYEGCLSEQINFALKKFDNIIMKKKQESYINFEIKNSTNNDISVAFQKKRNILIHTSLDCEFENIEIVGYILVRILVHCLVLKRASYDNENIKKLINNIF